MFEYTALVDAPVQRFTSIVTGPDLAADPMPVAAAPGLPAAPRGFAAPQVAEEPDRIVAVEPAPIVVDRPPIEPPIAAAPPQPLVHALVPRSASAPTPSIVPALIGIAAAGLTAFWWMRRDPHVRGK